MTFSRQGEEGEKTRGVKRKSRKGKNFFLRNRKRRWMLKVPISSSFSLSWEEEERGRGRTFMEGREREVVKVPFPLLFSLLTHAVFPEEEKRRGGK